MGKKNRDKNQLQGTNMSVQDQQDQSQKASDTATITGDNTKAPEGGEGTDLTKTDLGGEGQEDLGNEGDLPSNPNGEGDQPKDNSTATTGTISTETQTTIAIDQDTKVIADQLVVLDNGTQAPNVIDQGTQITESKIDVVAAATAAKEIPVQTAAKPTDAAVADVGVSVSDDSDLAKLLNQLQESGTVQQKTLVNNLKKYMEDMQPGKPTAPAQGAMHQMRLWEILRSVVENPDPAEFRKQMFIVRAFFKRYANEKTAFNDHYINRFAESWTRSAQQLAALQRLVNVFRLTADPLTTAEKLKHVDLARSLTHHFSEQHRQRVLAYFQQ